MPSLYDLTKSASIRVDAIEELAAHKLKFRTTYSVLASATSELGELASEVMADEGDSYKQAGDDGIVGEAIDVIVCLLDMIHVYDPEITAEELSTIAEKKLNKWTRKVSEVL